MKNERALAARLREALAELEPVVARVRTLAQKAAAGADEGYWDAVALNLHGYYTGLERIFEDIARSLDGSLPTGPGHQQLLLQMSTEVAGTRPAVLSRKTRRDLDEYRGFRHLVRNLYAYRLRPERVQEMADALGPNFAAVRTELLVFAELLETTA